MTKRLNPYNEGAYERARRDNHLRKIDDSVLIVVGLMHHYRDAWCVDCFWDLYAEPLYRAALGVHRPREADWMGATEVLEAVQGHLFACLLDTDEQPERCELPWPLFAAARGPD